MGGEVLPFTTQLDPAIPAFQYGTADDEYLTRLRDLYGLEDVVAGRQTDYDKVRALCVWVHNRWEHDGHSQARNLDPISILKEAALGKQFQCIEYSTVLTGALSSIGIPARTVYLKTADVETRRSGASHVVTEAWLRDQQKWVLVDAQWDIIPTLRNTPLSAVELQKVLATNEPDLQFATSTGAKGNYYFKWLKPYLYYFDTRLDQRFGVNAAPSSLMLVPEGAPKPRIFQRTAKITRMRYTNSVSTFYSAPDVVLLSLDPTSQR
ncbi:transglutaminase-like domain-containing protein [Hymenobacter sp. BT175]|uniref:transglutaminase-like domain-containing protein n=1 Tax=Hymenobacter translucens TaxID=2886507 RepID=UPI001D0EA5E5|nr:transglutaminase-like domain-containing protein [Hymenobacter translucens]MCC2545468.1 transglutaminase-like domain-containing protein [Hymenobacter translucens]